MTNYLIIDSNNAFAEKLHTVLNNQTLSEGENYWDSSIISDLGKLSDAVKPNLSENSIILVNAEAKIKDGYLQDQKLVELAFWFRCKHKIKNSIVFYSFQSVNQLLRRRPEDFIMLSTGCYHLQFPFSKQQLEKISNIKQLENLNTIKPYLKPRINLEKTRHTFANYAAMALMLNVIKALYKQSHINATLGKDSKNNKNYDGFYRFSESLEYYLLETFYSLETKLSVDVAKRTDLKLSVDEKSIMLIDDLADNGWQRIISQMIYGTPADNQLSSLKIHHEEENNKIFDYYKTKNELKTAILQKKPHLILLDLRLNNDDSKKAVTELGGYKLLRYIKSHPDFKGVPIVMFTASSNAETTKQLIEVGAEYVWTKPGIDEGLNSNQILKRYKMLIDYVKNIFFKFEEEIKLESKKDLEESKLKVLHKVEYIKYRANLSDLKNTPHYFNNFTDIFVDTNVVVEDSKTLCNVVKLAQICGKIKHKINVDSLKFELEFPKLVFDNYVIDEIIHHSKEFVASKPYFWKAGLVAYEVIRSLFQENLVRTELNSFREKSLSPECLLRRTDQESTCADDYLMKDIIQIISGNTFELYRKFKVGKKPKFERKNANYETPNAKVLLITNESKINPGKIPDLLTKKFDSLPNPTGTFEIMNIVEFNEEIEKIRL